MIRLPTVVLEHRLPENRHFDWLLGDPTDPGGALWTARVDRPPGQWLAAGSLLLDPLPPHRRAYLVYQGPVSRGRGVVRRVASGQHLPRLWTASRIVTSVRWPEIALDLTLTRLPEGRRWQASVRPV
jgi:hypothetical protein